MVNLKYHLCKAVTWIHSQSLKLSWRPSEEINFTKAQTNTHNVHGGGQYLALSHLFIAIGPENYQWLIWADHLGSCHNQGRVDSHRRVCFSLTAVRAGCIHFPWLWLARLYPFRVSRNHQSLTTDGSSTVINEIKSRLMADVLRCSQLSTTVFHSDIYLMCTFVFHWKEDKNVLSFSCFSDNISL